MQQEASSEEANAGAAEGDTAAFVIRNMKIEEFLPKSSLPQRALRNSEVQPVAKNVQNEKHGEEARAEEVNDLAGRCAGRKLGELLGNVRGDGVERRDDSNEERENREVDGGGDEARSKGGVSDGGRRGSGVVGEMCGGNAKGFCGGGRGNGVLHGLHWHGVCNLLCKRRCYAQAVGSAIFMMRLLPEA